MTAATETASKYNDAAHADYDRGPPLPGKRRQVSSVWVDVKFRVWLGN